MKIDKVKTMRRLGWEVKKSYGRAGPHQDKKLKRQKKKDTKDYLIELENEMNIGIADIVTAFDSKSIGSKVLNKNKFVDIVKETLVSYNFDKLGQAFIRLPDKTNSVVSSGVGKGTTNPDDYIIRVYRNQVHLYLKREFASNVENVFVVVYTREAYLNDPDVTEDEIKRIEKENYDYIIVAVIASTDADSPLSPYRFVHNLAGGNNQALIWNADKIRTEAEKIMDYWSSETGIGMHTVAD